MSEMFKARYHTGRRDFLRSAGLGAASLLVGAGAGEVRGRGGRKQMPPGRSAGETAGQAGRRRPNVLIIMTDQHRADLMTCAGRDLVATPNIDRIAERGVRFTNAYCPYPVCVASRMALLTGLYAHSTGAITNRDRLDWRYRTIANHFSEHVYLTALFGKMLFVDAHSHGFEYYMSINDWLMYLGPKVQHYANEIANHPLGPRFFKTVNDGGAGLPDVDGLWDGASPWVGHVERRDFSDMSSNLDAEDHLDMFLAREAAKFIRRYRDQPFFLVTSFMKPHSPFYPPRQWAERYPVDKMELPQVGDISGYPAHIQRRSKHIQSLGPQRLRAHRAGYLGNLAFVDTCVGRVYRELDDAGLLENTIVVYTSDHGEMDGDHGLYQKFCLFEPSVKVPLIVSFPGVIGRNKVAGALTEYFGLYPTLAHLAGLPMPESTTLQEVPGAAARMDASSFADILRRPDIDGPEAVFSEFNLRGRPAQYMVRSRRYKYVFNHGSTHELYDLQADPGESVNRVNEPGLKKECSRLQDRLFAWYNPRQNPYHPA
ncbi:MAG: sulfatase-like hydrolase/transferase [Phycisphaerales bacterium]|nr:MAG: sulfatase-like hydrolase/transferase [Phycisphaerales bacterium]